MLPGRFCFTGGVNNDEQDTRYVKPSQKATPAKADHAHEYIRPFAMMHTRRFDGTVSPEKHKFSLPAACVECGHVKRRNPSNVVEVEITPAEYNLLKNN